MISFAEKIRLILYDQGMKNPFRVRNHSIWSIYQAEDRDYSIGKNNGIYLQNKNCPE